jgi:hypothetical protein
MKVYGYEIPEGTESMSCIYSCGFLLVWLQGEGAGAGNAMMEHYMEDHKPPLPTLQDWISSEGERD